MGMFKYIWQEQYNFHVHILREKLTFYQNHRVTQNHYIKTKPRKT